MEFFDFKDIAEEYITLINPSSPEKVLKLGKYLGLNKESRVIEFGFGAGEILALWGKEFGVRGEGVEFREKAVKKAEARLSGLGLEDSFELTCGDGAAYEFEEGAFDVAAVIGATFIWKDFRGAIRAVKKAIKPGGKLAIGETYLIGNDAPEDYLQENSIWLKSQEELFETALEEGFEITYMIRSSRDEWDNYESLNWYGLARWIEENPDHPGRGEVIDYLHESREKYVKLDSKYVGWAMYILSPIV